MRVTLLIYYTECLIFDGYSNLVNVTNLFSIQAQKGLACLALKPFLHPLSLCALLIVLVARISLLSCLNILARGYSTVHHTTHKSILP